MGNRVPHTHPSATSCMAESQKRVLVNLSRQELLSYYATNNVDAAFPCLADDAVCIEPFDHQSPPPSPRSAPGTPPSKLHPPLHHAGGQSALPAMTHENWSVQSYRNTWIISGCFTLGTSEENDEEPPLFHRATFVWARTERGFRMVHVHLSLAFEEEFAALAAISEREAAGSLGSHIMWAAAESAPDARIEFHTIARQTYWLFRNEIYCIMVKGPHCTVQHIGGCFTVRSSLSDIQAMIPKPLLRTHRSCLVNTHYVISIARYKLTLSNGTECPIAEKRYTQIAKIFSENCTTPSRRT